METSSSGSIRYTASISAYNACGTQKELLALAESVTPAEDDICTAGETPEPPVELGEGEIWREEPWTEYCVWVDTIKKIASFHYVEQSNFMHFLQHGAPSWPTSVP